MNTVMGPAASVRILIASAKFVSPGILTFLMISCICAAACTPGNPFSSLNTFPSMASCQKKMLASDISSSNKGPMEKMV